MRGATTFGLLCITVSCAMAQLGPKWQMTSQVEGYDPGSVTDRVSYTSVADWAAHGFQDSTRAESLGHPFEPPNSMSRATASFDQSLAGNAVFRASSLLRLGYRVNESVPWSATSRSIFEYDLQIDNLSGSDLDIYFGNEIHGVMATLGQSENVAASERMTLFGLGQFNSSAEINPDGSISESGKWLGSMSRTTISDPFFGQRDAWQMNSFHFYGHRRFGAHSSFVQQVHHELDFVSLFSDPNNGSGLAMNDFGSTSYLQVRAFDPVTGQERTSDISVTIVPEPTSFVILASLSALALRRRRK